MKPQFFDIHSHINFVAFDEDREDVLKKTAEEETWLINVGTQKDTSAKALEIARSFSQGVYATVGLHPIHTGESYHDKKELGDEGKEFVSRGEEFDFEYYKNLAQDEKVVAIGECGLDYYRLDKNSVARQKSEFEKQINLANEVNKPLMLHIRNAYKDAFDILKSTAKVKGNVHFFAGNWEEAKMFLDFGFTISFTGVVTFARNYDDVIKNAPLDMMLSETDAPYVTPVPHRGKRNESLYVKEVVKKIAEIRGGDYEKVRGAMVFNAMRVFGLL